MKILLFPFRSIRMCLRLSGVKGALLFGVGVGIGLLAAPQTGAELRTQLAAKLAERSRGALPADEDLVV